MWIVKPGDLSRGREIHLCSSMEQVMNFVENWGYNVVAQKYMERPLLCYGKKFDMRQWVLVTSMNPLKIWLFQEPYIRFAPIKYDLNKIHNNFIHLTNHAITKKAQLGDA